VATIDIRITHIITLWYRNLSIFNALLSSAVPTVTPNAVNIFLISSFSKLYGALLSPRSKSYHVTAELLETFCHALLSLSPHLPRQDTLRILGSCSEQSESLPGNPPPPITVLRWTISRAFSGVTRLRCKNYF
jgi:hypothetical protein